MPLLEQLGVPRNADFYLCGPSAFLRGFTTGLASLGRRLRAGSTRRFSVRRQSITPGIAPLFTAARASARGLRVPGRRFRSHEAGSTVPWNSGFQSLLEFAEACDVPVKWSCRTGVCHTCECA